MLDPNDKRDSFRCTPLRVFTLFAVAMTAVSVMTTLAELSAFFDPTSIPGKLTPNHWLLIRGLVTVLVVWTLVLLGCSSVEQRGKTIMMIALVLMFIIWAAIWEAIGTDGVYEAKCNSRVCAVMLLSLYAGPVTPMTVALWTRLFLRPFET